LLKTNEDEEQTYTPTQIVARCTDAPYYFIGGSVYYLYTKKYPDKNQYMDPTGDVDVRLDCPKIISVDGNTDPLSLSSYNKSIFNQTRDLNEYMVHYTNWVLEQLYEKMSALPETFYEPLEEYAGSSKHIKNKLYFAVIQENNMVKIQIECKVKRMREPDHLLECVITGESSETLDTDNRRFTKQIELFQVGKKNYAVQSYYSLIEHNMQSMMDRIVLSGDKAYKHKFYNHVARLRYLNYIYDSVGSNILGAIQNVIEFIYFLWENIDTLDTYNYESIDHKTFIASMTHNFIKDIKLIKSSPRPFTIKTKTKYINITPVDVLSKYKEVLDKRGRTRQQTNLRNRSRAFSRKTNTPAKEVLDKRGRTRQQTNLRNRSRAFSRKTNTPEVKYKEVLDKRGRTRQQTNLRNRSSPFSRKKKPPEVKYKEVLDKRGRTRQQTNLRNRSRAFSRKKKPPEVKYKEVLDKRGRTTNEAAY
jgi:hypothetical protein